MSLYLRADHFVIGGSGGEFFVHVLACFIFQRLLGINCGMSA